MYFLWNCAFWTQFEAHIEFLIGRITTQWYVIIIFCSYIQCIACIHTKPIYYIPAQTPVRFDCNYLHSKVASFQKVLLLWSHLVLELWQSSFTVGMTVMTRGLSRGAQGDLLFYFFTFTRWTQLSYYCTMS